jgi:hypothetical protein
MSTNKKGFLTEIPARIKGKLKFPDSRNTCQEPAPMSKADDVAVIKNTYGHTSNNDASCAASGQQTLRSKSSNSIDAGTATTTASQQKTGMSARAFPDHMARGYITTTGKIIRATKKIEWGRGFKFS